MFILFNAVLDSFIDINLKSIHFCQRIYIYDNVYILIIILMNIYVHRKKNENRYPFFIIRKR